MLLIGGAAFGVATVLAVLAAWSSSGAILIATRVLLGIAGAMLMPSTLGLIRAMFTDPRRRATAVGVWISRFMGGMTVGPLVGGVLLETFWWGRTGAGARRGPAYRAGMTWPPPDTDRNRFLARLQVVIYVLITAYFLLFALVTGALVPWAICAVFLAATIVVSIALVHMRAQRRAADAEGSDRDDARPPVRPGGAG